LQNKRNAQKGTTVEPDAWAPNHIANASLYGLAGTPPDALEGYAGYHWSKARFYEACGDPAQARFHHRLAFEAAKAASPYHRPKLATQTDNKIGKVEVIVTGCLPPRPTEEDDMTSQREPAPDT
jgi:hypothetical protein